MATISLRIIMDSLALFIFLPEDGINTKLLQSDEPQQQV